MLCNIGSYLIKCQRNIINVIIVIIWSTFALKAGQLKEVVRFGGSLIQAVKKPCEYLVWLGTYLKESNGQCKQHEDDVTQVFMLGFELVSSTVIYLRTSLLRAC